MLHCTTSQSSSVSREEKSEVAVCESFTAVSRERCYSRASNTLIRSKEVTPNTSEAIYKLPALTASSYICSRAAWHRVHAYGTQYTAYWLHKSISKPHPPAFSADNTPVIRMDTDCLCCLGYFSAFGSNLKSLFSEKTQIFDSVLNKTMRTHWWVFQQQWSQLFEYKELKKYDFP